MTREMPPRVPDEPAWMKLSTVRAPPRDPRPWTLVHSLPVDRSTYIATRRTGVPPWDSPTKGLQGSGAGY
jgi:hypothetical protein